MTVVRKKREKIDLLDLIDCCISLTVEKKRDCGEDSEKHSFNIDEAFFGVFDGCGGAGAQPCPKCRGKTEAYIASRVVADSFQEWFENREESTVRDADTLKELVVGYLNECNKQVGEKSLLVGGIKKKFPTTAAAGICRPGTDSVEVDFYWAGDSRVYLLNDQGLAQLTEDDLGGIDAMEKLTDDGVLTNVISLSKDFTIHTGHISMDRPGIVFAATDGCFGYLSTPMEFEFLLLKTMLEADCISLSSDNDTKAGGRKKGWQEKITEVIGKIAGDDYTLSGYAIGFGSFEEMKKRFVPRANYLYSNYIAGLENKSYEEKITLWEKYRSDYYRLLCMG